MRLLSICFLLVCASQARAGILERGRQMVICHRMANRDAPENTLEALREASVLGCDAVELDIWKTYDGVLVLLHDGPIDRFSSGSGEVGQMLSGELALYDAGSWFNSRFAGIRHPRFVDAIRLAKDLGMKVILDIKAKGITRDVYEVVKAEGMLDRVSFGSHAKELPGLPNVQGEQPAAAWVPGMTRAQVAALQKEGKFVVAGFSAHDHEMDFPMMREAAAAGVDAINTDHARLASEAVGRSIERRALALAKEAKTGDAPARVRTILALAQFRDLPLTHTFSELVVDSDPQVSRGAALALLQRREAGALPSLYSRSEAGRIPVHAAANVSWLAGMLGDNSAATQRWLMSMAASKEPSIATEALRAISRLSFAADPAPIRPRLEDSNAMVRGAAARALARIDPGSAPLLIAAATRLQSEMNAHWKTYGKPSVPGPFGKHRTTFERPAPVDDTARAQILRAHELYRGYQNILGALASMSSPEALQWLHTETIRTAPDFSGIGAYVASNQLWDRVAPDRLARGMEMEDPMRRDRVEWTLIKHGQESAPALRALLQSQDADARVRAAQSLAWLGDSDARPALTKLIQTDPERRDMYQWCLRKLAEVEQLRNN